MSAPTVLSVTPVVDDTDVVLGTQITVLFSFLMDHTTINAGTFALTGPGQTMIVTPDQIVASDPVPVTGREYITGTFAFDDSFGGGLQTQVTFNPSEPLQPDTTYNILIMGDGGVLTSDSIADIYGNKMVGTYSWSFTTGELNLVVPPPISPVPGSAPQIDPKTIIVIPRQAGNQRVGADLTQEIDLIFPDSVDLTTYDPIPDILTSIEAILGDPDITIPTNLIVTPTWLTYAGKPNRLLKFVISGWPS